MLLNYDPNENGEFAQYVADEWGGEQFEQLAADLENEDGGGDTQPDKETDASHSACSGG